MQIYVGVKVYLRQFITLALNGVNSQLHAPAAVPHRKSPWYPLNRRLRGTQSQSRSFGKKTNLFSHHKSSHNSTDV
jgi:hypothetical protein